MLTVNLSSTYFSDMSYSSRLICDPKSEWNFRRSRKMRLYLFCTQKYCASLSFPRSEMIECFFFARASTHINGHKGGDPKIGRRPESRFAHEIDDNFTETMPANNWNYFFKLSNNCGPYKLRADINADGSEIPSVFTIIEIDLKVVGYKQWRFNLYKLYFCKQVLPFEFETQDGQNYYPKI